MSRSSISGPSASREREWRNCCSTRRGSVRDGRGTNNLYRVLKEEIEAGREAFRKEFVETCPSMVDYFHLELQRTLAKDNAGALGPDYPGPLPVGAGAGASPR